MRESEKMKQRSESKSSYEEASALLDEIDEESDTVREVLRIKKLLDARPDQHSENLLFESLRLLQLMELPVDTIKATDITTSVKCFLKYTSERIRKLAHLLVTGWELLLNKWMADTRENFDLCSAREGELPFDLGDILASQTSMFDLTNFFSGMADEWSFSRREQKRTGKNIEVLKRSMHKPQETFIMSTGKNIEVLKRSIPKPQGTSIMSYRNEPSREYEDLTYEEKLEISKRKLRENYENAENIKKKRRVVMIDPKSIPVQRRNQEKHKGKRGCRINKFATMLPKHNSVSLA